jgi:MmyB-like transcription regulator ligand binding domain
VLRLALHPDGMAPRIVNLAQWRGHLLTQLQRRARVLGDQRLSDLHDELLGYPGGHPAEAAAIDVVLPLRYRSGDRELSFFSISAAVGTATDVTVEELAIEAFYPADEATMAALRPAA